MGKVVARVSEAHAPNAPSPPFEKLSLLYLCLCLTAHRPHEQVAALVARVLSVPVSERTEAADALRPGKSKLDKPE